MVDEDDKLKQEEEEEEEDGSESQLAAGQLTINNMSTTSQALKPIRQPGKPKHLSEHQSGPGKIYDSFIAAQKFNLIYLRFCGGKFWLPCAQCKRAPPS